MKLRIEIIEDNKSKRNYVKEFDEEIESIENVLKAFGKELQEDRKYGKLESAILLNLAQLNESNLIPKSIWVKPSLFTLFFNRAVTTQTMFYGLPVFASDFCSKSGEDFIIGV